MNDSAEATNSAVVEIKRLTRQFGAKRALIDISLSIPRGGVFGLIGGNGAGKTTLIKHIMGMHYAQSGSVRVFGIDPVAHPVEVLGRIGYMSEERDIPNWMRVADILQYTRTFFPAWDTTYAEELREMFDLDPKQRIRNLSRGQAARVCLLLALAHRPELLVLDEPSSGLDPVVRRDILAAIVRTIAHEGRTVIFSSHLLDEVERLADRVAMIHNGQIVLHDQLDTIKETFRRLIVRFPQTFTEAPPFLGSIQAQGSGNEWSYFCRGDRNQLIQTARSLNAEIIAETSLSLDDIFVHSVSRSL